MSTWTADGRNRPPAQPVVHMARICCTPAASKLKRETVTTSAWQSADLSVLQMLRTLEAAGNERFGADSHWIERRYTAEPMA